jgi:dTDP-4-amino-4,6-dideoxygalactose transaminase
MKKTIFLKIMIEYENLAKLNHPWRNEFKEAFDNVLQTGWFILGDQVKQFENTFASYINVKHCIGVASGLDALELSILALDLEKGAEIIVPSNTYIATILAILNTGHIPVLVEPDSHTYNINPLEIEKAITKKTKAVLVVHLYGKTCEMDLINEICKNNKLYLIEDCAQAHGAQYKGKMAGSFGHLSAFSFYPTKNLGCLGDGGAVCTNHPQFYERVMKLRNYGSSKKYYNDLIGTNSRLDEIQAAFLTIKLKHLKEITTHKRELAQIYFKHLKSDFQLPSIDKVHFDVFHIFIILHEKRDQLRDYLLEQGIKTEIHYPVPPHKQKAMIGFAGKKFPVSEKIHTQCLSLPISTIHNKKEIYKVVGVMNKF